MKIEIKQNWKKAKEKGKGGILTDKRMGDKNGRILIRRKWEGKNWRIPERVWREGKKYKKIFKRGRREWKKDTEKKRE